MHFALMEPPTGRSPHNTRKKSYIYNNANIVQLGSGTLYVLHPEDDEDFIHTAWFEAEVRARAQSDCRVAFVYRWLSKRHRFYASGAKVGALVPTKEMVEAMVAGQAAKKACKRKVLCTYS